MQTVLESGTIEELRGMVNDLNEELLCTELDRDVFEAKLLGKWQGPVTQLVRGDPS